VSLTILKLGVRFLVFYSKTVRVSVVSDLLPFITDPRTVFAILRRSLGD
jgi:hypothetical protein